MMDCKHALKETSGDLEKAVKLLRTKGLADAAKRSGRTTTEGLVDSYIHPGGRIGVLIEVGCETDFVARNADFQDFVHDLAMHVAASAPRYLSRDEVPPEVVDSELAIYSEQASAEDKPENIQNKIAQEKLEKFYTQFCLAEQPFVKDDKISVEELRGDIVGKIGENVEIKRFVRYELGKES
ncbi:MAG: translation elongation factor Ts [Actinomycetota bacterium]